MIKFMPETKIQVNPKYKKMQEYKRLQSNADRWPYFYFSGRILTVISDKYHDGYISVAETCMRFHERLMLEVPDATTE